MAAFGLALVIVVPFALTEQAIKAECVIDLDRSTDFVQGIVPLHFLLSHTAMERACIGCLLEIPAG